MAHLDLSQVSGFLFDCDGVLLDSIGAWAAAEAELLAQVKGNLTREQLDEIHAVPFEECAVLFHERYGVGESVQDVWNHLEDNLMDFYRDRVEAMPGACDFVRTVRAYNIPCAVVSSSPERYLKAGIGRIGILDCFEVLVSTDGAGLSKQDVRIYEQALDLIGADKKTAWAIDDAPYAVAVLHKCGLNTIALCSKTDPKRRALYAGNADICITAFDELDVKPLT